MPVRKKKPKRFGTTLAYVRWFDSALYCGAEPFAVAQLDGYKENESCGLLVEETADRVSIALDRCLDTKNLRQVLCVPRANIRTLRKFKV